MAKLPAVTILVRWGSSVLQHRRLDPPREVFVQEDPWKQLDPAYLALPLDLIGLHEPAPLLQVENGKLLLIRWPHATVSVESPDSAGGQGKDQRSPYRTTEEAPQVQLHPGDVARVVAGLVTFEIHVDGGDPGPRESRLPPRWLGVFVLSAAVHAGALQGATLAAHRQIPADLEEASREDDLLRLTLLKAAVDRDEELDEQNEAEERSSEAQGGEGRRGDEGHLMTLEDHLRWLRRTHWRTHPIRYGAPLSIYRISEELARLDDEYLHPELPLGMSSVWFPAPWQPSLRENPPLFTEPGLVDPWLLRYIPGVGENDRRAAWFGQGGPSSAAHLWPDPKAGRARVTLKRVDTHGPIDKGLVTAASSRGLSRIRLCAEGFGVPSATVNAQVSFTVDKHGAASNIRVWGAFGSSHRWPSFSQNLPGCIARSLEGFTSLPAARGSAAAVLVLAIERP